MLGIVFGVDGLQMGKKRIALFELEARKFFNNINPKVG